MASRNPVRESRTKQYRSPPALSRLRHVGDPRRQHRWQGRELEKRPVYLRGGKPVIEQAQHRILIGPCRAATRRGQVSFCMNRRQGDISRVYEGSWRAESFYVWSSLTGVSRERCARTGELVRTATLSAPASMCISGYETGSGL